MEEDACQDEAHLMHCQVLAQAVARSVRERLHGVAPVGPVRRVAEPALRGEGIRVHEAGWAPAGRVVVHGHPRPRRYPLAQHGPARGGDHSGDADGDGRV